MDQGKFDWELYPELERFVTGSVGVFLNSHGFARALSRKMLVQTSTRFVDWIDHMILPESKFSSRSFERLGLEEIKVDAPDHTRVFKHMRSYLFPILIGSGKQTEVALKPESLDDFLQMLGLGIEAEGEPFAPLRKARISAEGNFILSAVERRGYDGFIVKESNDTKEYVNTLSLFYRRRRHFGDDESGMKEFGSLIDNAVKKLKGGRVSDAFFRAERAYWEHRNRAGQVQKARQDSLGLGWGNHDHHTYRSSRNSFTSMIKVFEKMGYSCRERYYAGERAGWGAQILEHPVCNIVVFTDVDLEPDETDIDFAHSGFGEGEPRLGTVGLWVGLHGESILQAGMHHLEARFVFERLTADLAKLGVNMMPPFSHFPFLKQAFTAGEMWEVERKRLDILLKDAYITREQHDTFMKVGALGSHMENLERDQGFKGFNRASVTKIIIATDPRKQHYSGA